MPTLGSERVEPHAEHPGPGVLCRGHKPLGCLEDLCDRQEGWGRLDAACEEGTGADFSSVQDRERSTLIVARFPTTT